VDHIGAGQRNSRCESGTRCSGWVHWQAERHDQHDGEKPEDEAKLFHSSPASKRMPIKQMKQVTIISFAIGSGRRTHQRFIFTKRRRLYRQAEPLYV
jgi:hypothetical protein